MTKCMKRHILMLSLIAAGATMMSCNETREENVVLPAVTESSAADYYATRTFAQPDDAKDLYQHVNGNRYALRLLLEKAGPDIINSLGRITMDANEYDEIATFTTELTKNNTTQTDKYKAIFGWITANIKYNNPQNNPSNLPCPNDPYSVFKNKMCICEGYSNLLTVMCYSQGIPAMLVNGFLVGIGGHAWVYTCLDATWMVSDPTNNRDFNMKKTALYADLDPQHADVDLFTDDVAVYDFSDYALNIKQVNTTTNPFVVPYSTQGFVISAFNPSEPLPKEITEIYIGQNIRTLGEGEQNLGMGIVKYGANIEAVYVDENNPDIMSHEGIVYRKNGDTPKLYYIPGGMTFIKMLPMETVEKNTICNHDNVKEIYFPEGTKRLEAYAIENCPKLERIYVPEETEISNNAIYKCSGNVEIVRGIPSGIKHVTM